MFKVFGDRRLIDNKLPLSMTFGNFDGVHIGHRKMLSDFMIFSKETPTCVLTFFPHPTRVFSPESPKRMILSLQERVDKLLETGVHCVVVQNFTEEFADLTADAFLSEYLSDNFCIEKIFIGYDFSYGKDRLGCFGHLTCYAEKEGWIVNQATPFLLDGELVSSSRIRELLGKGRVDEAEDQLGYPYALSGIVVQGDKRGRTIGFPTANLEVHNDIVPAYGVYACHVLRHKTGETYFAVMNCGYRPTLGQDLRLQIEAHLFDFDEDIYGERLSFQLKKFIRKEMRFSGFSELKEQIRKDVLSAKEFFETQ